MDSWHVVELADSGLHAMFPEMDEIRKVRCAGIMALALGWNAENISTTRESICVCVFRVKDRLYLFMSNVFLSLKFLVFPPRRS